MALALLAVLAVLLASWGVWVIAHAFRDHQDSPDATYFALGGLLVALSVLIGWTSLLGLSKRTSRARGTLSPLLLIAAVLPYALLVGSAGFFLNGVFGFLLLALGLSSRRGRGAAQSGGTRERN